METRLQEKRRLEKDLGKGGGMDKDDGDMMMAADTESADTSGAAITETKKTVPGQFTAAEYLYCHRLMQITSLCYVKEHLFQGLRGKSPSQFAQRWHDNVTKKNLPQCMALCQQMGLSLPIPYSLEARENEVKAALQGVTEPIVSEGEVLMDIKTTGTELATLLSRAATHSINPQLRDLFLKMHVNLVENLAEVMNAILKTDMNFPAPFVNQITVNQSSEAGR